ncbi:MAG: hydroxymyristoyl-ACP dehydratase [Bacteroidales bacterium]|nr:hydroxymyristoyl-ACP dehydratase [Bacteroidales bacterium]
MNPAQLEIIKLIPQRHPVIMIDRLEYWDEKCGKGILKIKEENVFCSEGVLQESGLIECIAQTAAAHTGFSQLITKNSVAKGFIGSIKNLFIHSLPPVGSEIHSEIIIDNEIMGFTIILGKIYLNNTILAECEMRIILENNIRG